MTEWQPDDPGTYARACDCCGRPTRSRERFCAPWLGSGLVAWAHVLRLVEKRSLLSRSLRLIRRGLASFDAWLGGEP